MKNIQVVDDIVKQTEALFSEFYRDDATAFVFTADHGMSRIGNHGDGGKVRNTYSHIFRFVDCFFDFVWEQILITPVHR